MSSYSISLTADIVTSTDNEGVPEAVVKLRTMYSSCMDTEAMETDGIPQSLLDQCTAQGDLGGWPAVIGDAWTGAG